MSQKSNLLTIRSTKPLAIITHNLKLWPSMFNLVLNLKRLFLLRGVLILKCFVGSDNNLFFLNLHLFYQSNKIVFYRKRLIKHLGSSTLKLSYVLNVFKNYKAKFNFSKYLLRVKVLNKFLTNYILYDLYKMLRIFLKNIFSRRLNLFYDFLKLTNLFSVGLISLESYSKIWGRIFKFLLRKSHNKFFLFVKKVFMFLTQSRSYYPWKFPKLGFIKGMKLLISGRLKGKSKASTRLVERGGIPQSIDKNLEFYSVYVYTIYGAFGLKFWSYKK
jgi:hypothetical protein